MLTWRKMYKVCRFPLNKMFSFPVVRPLCKMSKKSIFTLLDIFSWPRLQFFTLNKMENFKTCEMCKAEASKSKLFLFWKLQIIFDMLIYWCTTKLSVYFQTHYSRICRSKLELLTLSVFGPLSKVVTQRERERCRQRTPFIGNCHRRQLCSYTFDDSLLISWMASTE